MDSKNCIKRGNGWYKLYINGCVKELCDQKLYTDDIQKRWENTLEALEIAEDNRAAVATVSTLGGTARTVLPDSWPEACKDSCRTKDRAEKEHGKNRMELARETKDNMWEIKNEGEVPLPFWTVWDLAQYCTNCEFDSCTPENDCKVVKATMTHGEPWKWGMESCLLTHEDYQICVAIGAKCVTVNDMEKGVVTLWASVPEKERGVYTGRKGENGEREKPLAVIPTDKHFQALRHAGIIQGAMVIYLPKRLYDEWNKRQEEDF